MVRISNVTVSTRNVVFVEKTDVSMKHHGFFNKARSGILVSVLRVSARAGSMYKVPCLYLIYSKSYPPCMKMQKQSAI